MSYRLCNGIKFLKSLPDASVDGIFTDPPWGCANIMIKGQKRWKGLLRQLDREAARVLKPRGRVLIWIGARALGDTLKCFKNLQYQWFVLCRYLPMRFISAYVSEYDIILYFSRPGEKMYYRNGKKISQCFFRPSRGKKTTKHPCARPAEIVQRILNQFFRPGEYVIDPFAGSDTVGVACRDLGIKYDTCEIDPKMYKTGIVRNGQRFLFENDDGSLS